MSRARQLPPYTMRFEPMTIEHLGLRLYSTLPPVLNEFVTNAYDAEARKVEVGVPTGSITPHSEVVIRDYGHGLAPNEIQEQFLPIGRNRRGPDATQTKSKTGLRDVTGRKGLGKLSGLGIANEMQVRAIQNGYAVCLRLRYDEMKAWALNHSSSEPYAPQVVEDLTGETDDRDGLEIRLTGLYRRTPVNPDDIRRGIARRVRLIGPGFAVLVNGRAIGPGDRVERRRCVLSWDLKDTPAGNKLPGTNDGLDGWVGFLDSSVGSDRGVDIFATGKAVELGSFFNYSSPHAQFARAYLVGEVHAQSLDDPDHDLASTARSSVVWESDVGQLLQSWGQQLLQWSFDEWVKHRNSEREHTIIRAGKFDEWLIGRPKTEQRVAKRLVKLLARNEEIEPKGVVPLLEIVKASVETMAFRDLVESLEEEGTGIRQLLQLFDDWRIIEAREHLRLADGRVSAINQLRKYMDTGALEVSELQKLLVENLWLLDPSWSQAFVQPTYTKLLREQFPESSTVPDKNKRLDIVGVQDGRRLTIVELKRPEKRLARDDLTQIEDYVDWARAQIGTATGPDSVSNVEGVLLVGHMSSDRAISAKVERLAGHAISVQTFKEIHWRASEYFRELEKRLKELAPEYARSFRRKNKLQEGDAAPISRKKRKKAGRKKKSETPEITEGKKTVKKKAKQVTKAGRTHPKATGVKKRPAKASRSR